MSCTSLSTFFFRLQAFICKHEKLFSVKLFLFIKLLNSLLKNSWNYDNYILKNSYQDQYHCHYQFWY